MLYNKLQNKIYIDTIGLDDETNNTTSPIRAINDIFYLLNNLTLVINKVCFFLLAGRGATTISLYNKFLNSYYLQYKNDNIYLIISNGLNQWLITNYSAIASTFGNFKLKHDNIICYKNRNEIIFTDNNCEFSENYNKINSSLSKETTVIVCDFYYNAGFWTRNKNYLSFVCELLRSRGEIELLRKLRDNKF